MFMYVVVVADETRTHKSQDITAMYVSDNDMMDKGVSIYILNLALVSLLSDSLSFLISWGSFSFGNHYYAVLDFELSADFLL